MSMTEQNKPIFYYSFKSIQKLKQGALSKAPAIQVQSKVSVLLNMHPSPINPIRFKSHLQCMPSIKTTVLKHSLIH